MYDSGKVIIGLVIFLILITFPMWYNVATGEAENVPELEKPVKGDACVADTEYMRSFHMDVLNQWRDAVVRDGQRIYTAPDGRKFNMSLTHTCLDCHASRKNFCEKCHTYLKVTPYCWDCHTVPEEVAE
ncbi:MAG: sulfate reduction electron transfer complex DsrMKJOP subunit DsrJ [candidate division Zixibacteria bacterium]